MKAVEICHQIMQMTDNNFIFGNSETLEIWLSKIIEKALERFLLELKDPYYSDGKEGGRIMTLNEAAAYCNVCARTLTTRVKNGDLKNGGTGRKYLFKVKDLDEFMFKDRNSRK